MNISYPKAIKTIVSFKKAFDTINPKIPKKLVGELGEYYVLQELSRQGYRTEHKGGQGGYDVYLGELDKRIEVRTSLLKNEGVYPKDIKFWGWRVENRNQRGGRRFDHLVGVALDDDFLQPKFYIFTHEEAFKVGDVNMGRFGNVKKKIHLFENKKSYKQAVKIKPDLVTPFERQINLRPSGFLNKWGKIK